MKKRLHFHSDCGFFSGSENMVAVLLNDAELRRDFDVSFSYRFSQEYEKGLRQALRGAAELIPLRLPDTEDIDRFLDSKVAPPLRRPLYWAARLVLAKYWFTLWNTAVLFRLLREKKADILHVNNGGYPGSYSCLAAAVAGRLAGVPRIVMVVNNMAVPYRLLKRILDIPLDLTVRLCVSLFATASRRAAEQLRKTLRLPREKITNIYNGVAVRDPDESRGEVCRRLGLSERRPIVLTAGLLEERKGHAFLLEALGALRARRPPEKPFPALIIAGLGPQREALEERARRLSLGEDVRFVGYEDNLYNLLRACDVFALPSVAGEDLPNVVSMAMSQGKPVVACDVGGAGEQVADGETGFLVEPGRPQPLAEKIELLLDDAGLRVRLGGNARRRFEENFSGEAAVSRYKDLYRRLLRAST